MSDATSQSTSCMECGCPGVDVHYEGCPALIPGNKLAGKDAEIARLRVQVNHLALELDRKQRAIDTAMGASGNKVVALLENEERMRPVVDAALEHHDADVANDDAVRQYRAWKAFAQAVEDYRALDGEPCPDCVDGIAPKDGNDGGTRYACPTCGGSGWWSDRQRCEGCGGTGRKG